MMFIFVFNFPSEAGREIVMIRDKYANKYLSGVPAITGICSMVIRNSLQPK
jgi:hypothetical protein